MKFKKLLPIVALSGIATVATPLIASCANNGITGSVLRITEDGILKGFKEGATKSQIEKEFGDTFTIPKEVKYVVPYAFVDNGQSTIPESIKNFKFEDEYQCKEIGKYAFAYAPFEDITITCERNQPDGEEHHEFNYWNLQGGAWGLTTIGDHAFFQDLNLKTVKLPGTMRQGYGDDCFACQTEDGTPCSCPNLERIDFSDLVTYPNEGEDVVPSNLPSMFCLDLFSSDAWSGTLVLRFWGGDYGPDVTPANQVAGVNEWLAGFTLPAVFEVGHQFGPNGTIEYWGE